MCDIFSKGWVRLLKYKNLDRHHETIVFDTAMFRESGGTLNGPAYHSRKVVLRPSSHQVKLRNDRE